MARGEQPEFVQYALKTKFAKRAVNIVSYALASAIVATSMALWPASTKDIVARLNLVPERAVTVSDRNHKADRLATSFEQRWSTIPAPAAQARGTKGERQSPQAGRGMEKVPFSCELAFSRTISNGNLSTRCIAAIGANTRLATAE
jgi:hypothetical protein